MQTNAAKASKKSMAEMFVSFYNEWDNSDLTVPSFFDFLKNTNRIGLDDDQICFLQFWSTRPVLENRDKFADVICDYAVMDFEDGSIAIRRNHDRESNWLVAV
jgi:hypothetical protein